MNLFKYIKCLLFKHDISDSKSIVETICSDNWLKKCNCCGRYIMHGEVGSICISERRALKIKREFEKLFIAPYQYMEDK